MGNPRSTTKPPPRLYRDRQDRDSNDTTSTSSVVHLSDIEYPVEETPLTEGFPEQSFPDDGLPAYSDVPNLPQSSSNETPIS